MTRLALVLAVALLLAAALGPAPAHAATRAEIADLADRAATVWAGRQDPHGFFLDPRTGAPVEGYGNAMIGYALLRAGERRGDGRLVASGVRGIGTTLGEPPAVRGVFDVLAIASAYNFARAQLDDDAAFEAARPRWEDYLRETRAPNIDNEVYDCIVATDCFHNHEAVGAAAALELLATGLTSKQPGARLADPVALRRAALTEVGVAEPAFARGDASWRGKRESEHDLALLSDTGNFPLAYHALSTAMLARSVQLLGDAAPAAARAALRRTTGALAALMAPDGAVAYIGKRQESLWSLAATVAAAEIAIGAGDAHDGARDRYRAASDRALARIRARYPLTGRGLPIVPRSGPRAFVPDGVDGDPMTFNGLALFLLGVAADAAPDDDGDPAALPADANGAFVDRAQNKFAAVRRGDVWFAVHGRDRPRDVRNDFGLVAAKWLAPSGGWVDILRPRPLRFDDAETAGPVVERAGRRLVPRGGRIAVRHRGRVEVAGRLGGEPATFTFTPTARGVRIALPVRAGDVVTYSAYLPAADARRGRRGSARGPAVSDRDASVIAAPPPASVRLDDGFSSCCDVRMVAARIRVPVRADGRVSFTVAARRGARGPAPLEAFAARGSTRWWIVALGLLAATALGLTLRRRAVVRRRRRSRRRRRYAAPRP